MIDAIIVGAGPAGSSLAWRLARAGLEVGLLDARSFPRSKPCGDAISPGATPILRELGVAGEVEADATRLAGWRLRTPAGRWFEGRFAADDSPAPKHGFAISRERLDAACLAGATAAGVEFEPGMRAVALLRDGDDRVCGVRVRGRHGAQERRARWVIGADGLRSVVARRLGPIRYGRRRRLALVGRFAGTTVDGSLGSMRISREGCLGLAPLGGGRCNATVVVPAHHARSISADRWGFYRSRLRAYGVWPDVERGKLTGPLEITGPFELRPSRVSAPGVLLVGDAAGYLDPFTGQGIYRALQMARMAAAVIIGGLERPGLEERLLSDYERRLRRFLQPGRRVQRAIDRVIGSPRAFDTIAPLLERFPGLADLLVDVTGDRIAPASLLSPARLHHAIRGTAHRPEHRRRVLNRGDGSEAAPGATSGFRTGSRR